MPDPQHPDGPPVVERDWPVIIGLALGGLLSIRLGTTLLIGRAGPWSRPPAPPSIGWQLFGGGKFRAVRYLRR